MCLYVNSPRLIAETDLIVYKCLRREPRLKNTYVTPMQGAMVAFGKNGKFHLRSGAKIMVITNEFRNKTIHEGIHAYTYEYRAYALLPAYCEVFYAIIPKGRVYYLGFGAQVVSSDMIIFRNKDSFNTYMANHKVKEIDTSKKLSKDFVV